VGHEEVLQDVSNLIRETWLAGIQHVGTGLQETSRAAHHRRCRPCERTTHNHSGL